MIKKIQKNPAEKLRYTRRRLGWTQKELAAHLSCHFTSICAWEKQKTPVPAYVSQWANIVTSLLQMMGTLFGETNLLFIPSQEEPGKERVLSAADILREYGVEGLIDAIQQASVTPNTPKYRKN